MDEEQGHTRYLVFKALNKEHRSYAQLAREMGIDYQKFYSFMVKGWALKPRDEEKVLVWLSEEFE